MIKDHDTTTFDLSEYDAEPFELDYIVYELGDDEDAPEGSWCSLVMNHSFSPEPVEVADMLMAHIGRPEPGQFKDLLETVKMRYQKLADEADIRKHFSD